MRVREEGSFMSLREKVLYGAALSLAVTMASTAWSEIYRYVDGQGEMHVVSDLSMIPEQYRDQAIERAAGRSGGSVNIVEGMDAEDPAAPAPASTTPWTAGSAATTSTDSAQIGGHDQFWWRSQAQERQSKIADLTSQLEAAQAEEEDFSDQIYSRPGNGRGGAAGPGHHRGRGRAAALSAVDDTDEPTVEELEQRVESAERNLSQFEDQARRAGVPPGWLR
jgi:hypothetical protein